MNSINFLFLLRNKHYILLKMKFSGNLLLLNIFFRVEESPLVLPAHHSHLSHTYCCRAMQILRSCGLPVTGGTAAPRTGGLLRNPREAEWPDCPGIAILILKCDCTLPIWFKEFNRSCKSDMLACAFYMLWYFLTWQQKATSGDSSTWKNIFNGNL